MEHFGRQGWFFYTLKEEATAGPLLKHSLGRQLPKHSTSKILCLRRKNAKREDSLPLYPEGLFQAAAYIFSMKVNKFFTQKHESLGCVPVSCFLSQGILGTGHPPLVICDQLETEEWQEDKEIQHSYLAALLALRYLKKKKN